MKLFITFGTQHYLEKLPEASHEHAILLESGGDAALLAENEETNPFEEGHSYEILNSRGNLKNGSFAVLNHIQVTDEGRALFEERFHQRAGLVEKEPGFAAIRVLRPDKNDPYIILTLWESQSDFINWQQSSAYAEAHKDRGTGGGLPQTLFSGPSYVKQYRVLS
ncbi:antibiotic biosynthesis monooxygenase [Fictibacillus enclensis]|uniref:antibiotic biosynthesis monooxygenase family protein n=1 Tax=Fictibacillus enclensis TaxID=1017270 RepID=UPI0025A0E278|nr:antibiotic biosynthesis monooxygenase [Fictibacillus enclensis]MDM5197709.1 antibiotic biosynthesis monooxygenase [Fictibacillus enclensis]